MYRIMLLSILALSMQGCSAFGALSAFIPSGSNSGTQVQTEANLGKTNTKALSSNVSEANQDVRANSGEVIAGNKQQQSAQAINNHHDVGLDVWQLILIVLLCLLVPSPFTPLYDRFKRWVS